MPAHCGSVLMSGRDRKAFRASQIKRQQELARTEKEIQRMEGQHDDEPDDRKRKKVCYCIPLPINGCCFFSLRGCVLFTAWILVILHSLSLLMVTLDAAGWYQGVDPFDKDPLFKNSDLVHYTFMVDSILQIFVGLLLIIGVSKEYSKLQIPYLVTIIFCNIGTMTVVLIDWSSVSKEVIAQRFIAFFAHAYMWIHVLSYYFITKEHEERTNMLDR